MEDNFGILMALSLILSPGVATLLGVLLRYIIKSKKDNTNTKPKSKDKKDTIQQALPKQIDNSQSINYRIAKRELPKIIESYENVISKFAYKKIKINDDELLYEIENSLIVYLGIDTWNGYSNTPDIPFHHVLLEELTPNFIFKFIKSHIHSCTNMYVDYFRALKFNGIAEKKNLNEIKATKFFVINEKYPNLNIILLAESWQGKEFCFVVFKLYDEDGCVYNIEITELKNAERFVSYYCNEINPSTKRKHYENYINNTEFYNKIIAIHKNYVDKNGDNNFFTFRGHLKYLIIKKNLKENKFQEIKDLIYENIKNGIYEDAQWFEYGRFEGRWKSEQLVYEFCKKIYGDKYVLFQYSPWFLGQQSYDVFITSENTAIEYQGKQHFEPVEFFGGEESFKKQVERDNTKKLISEQYGVNLVYINYDEDITEELIKERVNNGKTKENRKA